MTRKTKKNTSPNAQNVEQDDAFRVGRAIRRIRKQRRMKQAELAELVEMQPAQLCNSEKGNNLPSLKTLRRICDALGVSVNDLVYPSAFLEMTRRIEAENPGLPPTTEWVGSKDEELLPILSEGERLYNGLREKGIIRTSVEIDAGHHINEQIVDVIQRRITDYMLLESMCGVSRHIMVPLTIPFTVDNKGATLLASKFRMHCGIGTAVVFDAIELLENHGLRILFTELPKGVDGLSFYDAANTNAFIIVSDTLGCERQIFTIMVELANIYLYTRNDNSVVFNTDANRHFAKRFAAEMLMPADAVLTSVSQIGILPDQWNLEMLLRTKSRFGVSAESFLYRLDELELLPVDGKLRDALLGDIKRHYEKTGFAEPGDCFRHVRHNARFEDLLLCASLTPENVKVVRDIELRVKKNYPLDMRIEISPPPTSPPIRRGSKPGGTGKRGRPKKQAPAAKRGRPKKEAPAAKKERAKKEAPARKPGRPRKTKP